MIPIPLTEKGWHSVSGFRSSIIPPARSSVYASLRFIRQTGLGLFKRSFLRIEGELALPFVCNNLLVGSSLS
jgi:hypothetical protein